MGEIHSETMQRKPILMPPRMIKRVGKIAKKKKVSFAEVVREAVDAFEGVSQDDVLVLEALADTLLAANSVMLKRMNELEAKLDSTHKAITEADSECK